MALGSTGGPLDVRNIGQTMANQAPSAPGKPVDGQSFKKFLLDSIDQVNRMQVESDEMQQALATGQTDDIVGVMSAVEKADVAFNTLLAIRNKLIESYQETLRMQI